MAEGTQGSTFLVVDWLEWVDWADVLVLTER